MRHSKRFPFLLAVTPLILLATACATTGGSAPDADPAPAARADAPSSEPPAINQAEAAKTDDHSAPVMGRETTPDRTRRESVPAHVRELREQMEEAYQSGLEAYQAGRFDEAKEHFDRAVDCVLSSDVDLNQQPAFKKAFDEIVRNIADMDADLYAKDSEPEAQEDRSPLDNLKDISTYLP